MNNKYIYNMSDDDWSNDELCDTYEEAVEWGRKEAIEQEEDTYFVGKIKTFVFPLIEF